MSASDQNENCDILYEDLDIGENVEIEETNSGRKICEERANTRMLDFGEYADLCDVYAQADLAMKDHDRIKPDPRAMRILLRHLYDTTGQLYEDVPQKFRTSHVSLALYLRHCLQQRDLLL